MLVPFLVALGRRWEGGGKGEVRSEVRRTDIAVL